MIDVFFGSGNKGKLSEYKNLFLESNINIVKINTSIEVNECGETFEENALIKATEYFKKYKSPVMTDDSGLVIEALPNLLGIHSARFGGKDLNQKEKNILVLDHLKNEANRKAHFVCVLCFYFSENEIYFFNGKLFGSIGHVIEGNDGFGYDPIFIPEGKKKSLGDLNNWKNEHSHRAISASKAITFFKNERLESRCF